MTRELVQLGLDIQRVLLEALTGGRVVSMKDIIPMVIFDNHIKASWVNVADTIKKLEEQAFIELFESEECTPSVMLKITEDGESLLTGLVLDYEDKKRLEHLGLKPVE